VIKPTNKGHPDVIDREPQRMRKPKVALAGGVGPCQRDQHAERQQQEVIDHEGERRSSLPLDRSDIDAAVWHEVLLHCLLLGLTSSVADR
jgi:hypothetical protein